jgi:outer membrane protein assembly factor BamB
VKKQGYNFMLNLKKSFALSVCLLALSACGGDKTPPLQGERVDVLVSSSDLVPDTDLYNVPLLLPEQIPLQTWAQVGGFSHHRPTHVALPEHVEEAWRERIGCGMAKTGLILNPPVVYAETVYAMNSCGEVIALNAKTGKKIWKEKLEIREKELESYSGGLAVNNTHVYITTGSGDVFALNAKTGELAWKENLGMPLRASPALQGDHVYVVSHNNRLFALDKNTGKTIWLHSGLEEALALMGGAPPAVDEDVSIVPYSSGEIYALNSKNGRYLWHNALSSDNSFDPLANLVDIEGTPVIASGMVHVVNNNGWLSVFDLKSGRRYWERKLSAVQMPWVAGNAIFIVTSDNKLVNVHRIDGRVRWVRELTSLVPKGAREQTSFWSGPLFAGGRLIVVSNNGYAVSVNPKSGEPVRISNLKDQISLAPIAAGGTLYFMSDDAEIIAYR